MKVSENSESDIRVANHPTSDRVETVGSSGYDHNARARPHENRPPFYAVYYIMRVK